MLRCFVLEGKRNSQREREKESTDPNCGEVPRRRPQLLAFGCCGRPVSIPSESLGNRVPYPVFVPESPPLKLSRPTPEPGPVTYYEVTYTSPDKVGSGPLVRFSLG